jgi:hypothetical protein
MKPNSYGGSGSNELLNCQGNRWMHGKKSNLGRECRRRSQRALTPRIRVKPEAKGFGQ